MSSDPKLDNLLCFALYSATHAFGRVYKPLLDDLGLTYPQYLAMLVLWEQDDQTVGSLGQRLSLESNTLTPLLKRLEAMGHVQRSRDPADERQVRIRLTPQGRALQEKGNAVPACLARTIGLDVEDVRRMMRDIGTLRKALDAAAPR
ncbi:MarR family winged helix-turn-helix transcriptional regulator [Arenibaculum pallidiluteum]|uniref:MarR family winged helix-turn-helix transcriptional regulator n=1 Tax=Arenibaculum pallidiluteum TaxID=2812559 RepID=UPI001A972C02|nr:MarR family transcriptional regulator [Arenibaculum pallidiluteum]